MRAAALEELHMPAGAGGPPVQVRGKPYGAWHRTAQRGSEEPSRHAQRHGQAACKTPRSGIDNCWRTLYRLVTHGKHRWDRRLRRQGRVQEIFVSQAAPSFWRQGVGGPQILPTSGCPPGLCPFRLSMLGGSGGSGLCGIAIGPVVCGMPALCSLLPAPSLETPLLETPLLGLPDR